MYLETKGNKEEERSEFLLGSDNDIEFLKHLMNILLKNWNKNKQKTFNNPLQKISSNCAAYLMTFSAALSYEHLHTANRLLIQGGKLIPFKSCWSLIFGLILITKLRILWMFLKLKASFRILVLWALVKELYTLVCVCIHSSAVIVKVI